MPLVAAALVPMAPLLWPALTGATASEALSELRAAVDDVLARLLADAEVGLVAAPRLPGTLHGFGGPNPAADNTGADSTVPSAATGTGHERQQGDSWPHDLGVALLDRAANRAAMAQSAPDDGEGEPRTGRPPRVESVQLPVLPADPAPDPALRLPAPETMATATLPDELAAHAERIGVLVLADGSATRGTRAPGGDDPRGTALDAALGRAVRQREDPVRVGAEPAVAAATGCRGLAGVALFAALARRLGPAEVGYEGAPFGVGYLVAFASARTEAHHGDGAGAASPPEPAGVG